MSVSGLSLKPGESQDWSAGDDSSSPGGRAQRGTVPHSRCSLLLPFPAHPCSWSWAESRWGATVRELRAHQDQDGCGSQGSVRFGDSMNGSGSPGTEDTNQEVGSGGWQPEAVLVPLLFALIFFVGTVGNALVLAVLLRGGQAVSTTNLFILNLGVADLCFILCCVPFQATIYTLDGWVFGSLLCKAVHFLIFLTMHASSFTLAAVSLDR